MSWDSGNFQLALVFGLFVIIGCVALFVDYLKSYNEQLRERNIDLAARQQERERWFGNSPEAFAEKIAGLLRSAQGLPAVAVPAISGASARARHRAANYGATGAVPQQEPLAQPEEAASYLGAEDPGTANAEAVAERRPRTRPRREGSPSENWVSKEELEKLAERAARIRARYGTMTGEDPANTVPAVLDPRIESDLASAPPTAEGSSSEADNSPQAGYPPFEQDIEPAASDAWRYGEPFDRQPDEARAESGYQSGPYAERPALPPDMPEAEIGEEPAGDWGIPSSPAQARISASVEARSRYTESDRTLPQEETREPRLITPSTSPGGTSLASAPAPAVLAAVQSYGSSTSPRTTLEFEEDHVAQSFENKSGADGDNLDALFDQTYGSPTWLAMNGQEPGAALDSILPTGLFEGAEFSRLMEEGPVFTGVAVSIRINDFASVKPKLSTVEGIEAMGALSNLIRSLLREDRDFAGKSQEDEYVLLFPGDIGDEGQRRLFHLSERLWDFQLRSLGGLALMLSWGGLEIENQTVPEAVAAARNRLEESRRGRAKPGSTFRSARRAS